MVRWSMKMYYLMARVIEGDGINYMIYAMGRMTYVWGEDAEEFRPERWLVNGFFQQESPYKFISFNVSTTSLVTT
jgi:cytochrome P450